MGARPPRRSWPTSLSPMPETVSVAMAEIAGSVREGLLALAVSAGMQVMAAMMERT